MAPLPDWHTLLPDWRTASADEADLVRGVLYQIGMSAMEDGEFGEAAVWLELINKLDELPTSG